MTDQVPNACETDELAEVPADDRPKHIAIIMDGNGRWAQGQGLPRIEGHRRGVNTVRVISETATELGIEAITLYCCSFLLMPSHSLAVAFARSTSLFISSMVLRAS